MSKAVASAAPRKLADVSRRLRNILNLEDFERAARAHLPRPIFGYVSGGVEDNVSMDDNRAAFRELGFVPRFMVGVTNRSMAATLLSAEYAAPFGIAPMGITALSAYRGDLVLAQAAKDARIPMVVSGSSLIRLEDIVAVNPNVWFQAYLPPDLPGIDGLIDRAARAGVGTLVITVDTPVYGNRENLIRAGFSSPLRPSLRLAWDGLMRPRWLVGTFLRTLVSHGIPHFENGYATRGAPVISKDVERDFSGRSHQDWNVFRHIRARWKGLLVVKGILHADDARIACECGADAIIASNHGGRQLDGAVSALRVLPGIVAAAGAVPVMLDGGIRRGTDIMKALALGARFVWVGRPFNYAVAVGGAEGIDHAIRILMEEVIQNMGALGLNALPEMTRDRLMPLGGR